MRPQHLSQAESPLSPPYFSLSLSCYVFSSAAVSFISPQSLHLLRTRRCCHRRFCCHHSYYTCSAFPGARTGSGPCCPSWLQQECAAEPRPCQPVGCALILSFSAFLFNAWPPTFCAHEALSSCSRLAPPCYRCGHAAASLQNAPPPKTSLN